MVQSPAVCCPLSVWPGLAAKKKKKEDLKQPVTTGYRSDNVTDLIIIQFIIILCGFKVCRGFKYQNTRERSHGGNGVR